MKREFSVEERNYIEQLRGLVNDADKHLALAGAAHDEGDDRALAGAHRALGGVLRSMHRTFASMAKAGEQADHDANTKAQTSAGGTEGTSSPPRTTPGLMTGDPMTFLERARIGGNRR